MSDLLIIIAGREKYEELWNDTTKVLFIILGNNDPDFRQIASDGEDAAGNNQEVRRVIWIKDTHILSDLEIEKFKGGDDEIIACFFSVNAHSERIIVKRLNKSEALDYSYLDLSFGEAEVQYRR